MVSLIGVIVVEVFHVHFAPLVYFIAVSFKLIFYIDSIIVI